MASSDEEYVQDISSDEATPHQTRGVSTRTSDLNPERSGRFDVNRTWEDLPTDEAGNLRTDALGVNRGVKR